ncbi:MAG: hypothetical protein DRN29_00935 [Thermoplasmata archaeon]|nr:MAG: hypothetical protein DRN29_00935 [Thermoplasmata archaeon]
MRERKLLIVFVAILLLWINLNGSVSSYTEEKIYFYVFEKEDLLFKFVSVYDGSNYTWDFGDGSIGYGKVVEHQYLMPGTYEVRLIVRDNGNEIVNYSQTINTANIPPIPDFYYSPEYPYTLETVFFFDNSTDPDGYIINWTWHFGDGGISYLPNPNHTYLKAGEYNVTLTVVDNEFKAKTVAKQIIVRNRHPVAKFYWTKGEEGTLIFYANYLYDPSYDPDGSIVNYTWDFGDGSIGYGEWVEHVYAKDGVYNVTLTVYDDNGDSNSTTRKIHSYNEIPVADFEYTPEMPTDLDNITFISTSYDPDGTIENHTWTLGDGTMAYNETFTHRYADDGYYTVWLWVVDNEGAFNYTHETIHVRNVPPVANFTWEPYYPIPNRNITFNASSSYDLDGIITTYQWKFGDGGAAFGMVVNHSYAEDGVYNVTLTVYDDDGNSTSIQKKLLVADFYVDENVFDPLNHTWNRIQDAVDNATDGTFIYVRQGTYNEDVYIDKAVKIIAENATLKGSNYSFYLAKDGIIIKNFIIKNSDKGVVIDANNVFIENFALNGNKLGFIIKGNENIIMDVTVDSSNASLIIEGDNNYIENGSFHGNIYGCKIYGENNILINNSFSGLYGVYIEGSSNFIERNYVSNSIYGLYLMNANEIENNTIEGCSYGMKIMSYSFIKFNKFIGNTYGIEAITYFAIKSAYFAENKISISSKDVEASNISIFGGDYGVVADNGTIHDSSIQNVDVAIKVKGEAHLHNISIQDCNKGIEGDGEALISDCQFINNYIGIDEIESNVLNSIFADNYYAIKGHDIIVFNSTFTGNEYGFSLTDNDTVKKSTFTGNKMALDINGENNVIEDNIIEGNTYGIKVEASHNSIKNNVIENNTYGIRIIFSSFNLLQSNEMNNNLYNFDIEGSKLHHFYQMIDESNKINGKSMFYLINQSNNVINQECGYLALINCSNISIEDLNMEHNGEGLLIVYSDNIHVSNCNLSANIDGMYILNGEEIYLEELYVINNYNGISSKTSSNIFISNGNFINNSRGINLFYIEKENAMVKINNTSIEGNELGINVENLAGLSIENLTFENNDKALRAFNANLSIEDCIFYGEYGIEAIKTYIELSDTELSGNQSFYADSSTVSMNNVAIHDSAIGIKSDNSSLAIHSSSFYGNGCGVAILVMDSYLSVFDCSFINNTWGIKGNTYIEVDGTEFSKNSYAIEVNLSDGEIANSEFAFNSYGIIANNSSLSVINVTIYENEYGISLNSSSCIIKGGDYYNNSVAVEINGSENVIDKILFHHNSKAVILNGKENKVVNSSFWKNLYGLVAYGVNNTIYHNNFVYNIENARDYGNNIWNASYPTGGNYWHDYAGEDYFKGKKQNESGSDGIGDIPHEIYGNLDYYPLMDYYENASAIPNEPPVASFYFYPSSPYSLEEVIFIDTSYDENGKEDIVLWRWDFGDGNTSDLPNPKHVYGKAGVYNVTLYIEDKAGANSSIKTQIEVRNLPPVANFSWSPTEVFSYTLVEFNASSSYDSDGSIVNYTWNFGDGNAGYGVLPTHKYTNSGTYIIVLTVRDDMGAESSMEIEFEVKNRKPDAKFIFTPEEPYAGEEINFTDLSSDLDGKIVEWRWDFGDGSIVYGKDVTHAYDKAGEYTVTLQVKDDEGAKANYSMTIKIKEKETPGFEIAFVLIAFVVIVARRLKKFK